MLMRSLIILLTLTSVSGLSFFCTQFRPLKVRINETAIRGSVIKTILEPDDKVSSVHLLAGDLSYLNINVQRRQLRLLKPVRDKRGQILIVTGTCSDYLEPYRYLLNLSVSIEVEILDVNDPPQFINLPTSTSVSESTTNGSWVFDIQADNPDDVYNDFTKVYYSILSSGSIDKPQKSVDSWFIVDDNGGVHLNTNLDFEEGPRKIKLVVKVQDFGSPAKRNISTLTILVKDVDDMGPRFDQQFVSFTIIGEKPVEKEECLPTTPPLHAEDQDAEIKSPIGYRLNQVQETNSSINWSKYFHINPITGHLCQRHTIQNIQTKRGDITVQEVMDAFNLTVEAFQLDDPDKTARAVIMVKISNENLYKPTFLQIDYTVTLPEYPLIGPGTLVTPVIAEDRDYGRNGEFLLSLSVNPFNAFSINPTTGEIRVEKPELIDREQNTTLILKVKAEETKSVEGYVSSPEAQVQITLLDVNDNSPIFNKGLFNFTVKDNHQIGTAIHKFEDRLVAEDADEGKNGLVRLAIVSVQNMRGTFSLNDYQRFRINDEGVIILQSSLRALRREENLPEYIVVVQARDSDENEKQQRSTTTRVFIRVLEANDYPPVFEKKDYKVYISEAAPVGTLITEIKVTDEDGDEDLFVKYEITSGNIGDDFRISESGFLFIERPLDREKVSFYHLTVSASDGLHVRETMVTVDVRDTNDNSPVFNQTMFDFYIPENVTTSLDIGLVTAVDADDGPNSKLVYRLSGTNSHIFNITKDGLLVLNGPSPIVDREKTEVIILQVVAEDLGQPPQKEDAMIRIYLQDINDEPPVFTHSIYRVKMMEPIASDVTKNQPIDMDVSLTVTDNDVDAEHRDVVYSLHDGGLDLFQIDETTGSLFVTDTSFIDCEVNDTYTFKISAFDGNFTSFTTLILDIEDRNDNSPRFTSNMSFVSSPSSRIGSLVGHLTSEDKDVTEQNSHVVYLLLGGSLDKFSVNSNTGEIRVIDDLTQEPFRRHYSLKVKVVDFGQPQLSDEAVVEVYVPINESPVVPQQFVFRINESFPTAAVIGQLTSTDPDHGVVVYRISGSDDTLPFYITNDGSLHLAARLDTEKRDVYNFPVDVINYGEPNVTVKTYVTVYVEDVNDEVPLFSAWFYTAVVPETNDTDSFDDYLSISPPLGVTDIDAREDEQVLYSLGGSGAEDFIIDSLTGTIVVNQSSSIDCERKCEYNLKLIARDENGEGLEGFANLNIKVTDINDNPPIVTDHTISYYMEPASPIGSRVGQIKAEDGDYSDVNNRLTFALTDGGAGKFFIHPSSGVLALSNSLLQDPVQELYEMTVTVIDSGTPPLSSFATVKVHVPVNTPIQINTSIHLLVSENETVGSVLWTLQEDKLKVENISYMLEYDSETFIIEENTGNILLKRELDAEKDDQYSLPILVIDHGEPTYTFTTTVNIELLDVNDNYPTFSTPSYQAQIPENNDPKTKTFIHLVPPLDVTDLDITSHKANITYRLIGDESDMFQMDLNSGEITVQQGRQLDCEVKCDYQFQIIATDENGTGLSSAAFLDIEIKDENDHRPEYHRNFSFSVKPSVPIGREIGTVRAADEDKDPINNRLLYYLTGLGGYGKFQIETDTGTIYTTDSLLRSPVLEDYYIKVVAVDFGSPQLSRETTVHIHVPVHPIPRLSDEVLFSVEENQPSNTVVGQIQINTTDKIHYILGVKSDIFHLNKTSGILKSLIPLDAEDKHEYILPVSIAEKQNGLYTVTTLVTVTVTDVDDYLPTFSSDLYKTGIKEGVYNSPVELHLEPVLEITDGDSDDSNRLYNVTLQGKHSELFYISPDNLRLFIYNSTYLDRENTRYINLQIVAEGGRIKTQAELIIEVEDVNDNTPEFVSALNMTVIPVLKIGSVLGKVEAKDADDSEPNNQISYILQYGGVDKINLNSKTGEIILKKSFVDEPLQSEFNLVIEARDMGYPARTSSTTVQIVVPLNQPPVVPESVYFTLEENVALGSRVQSLGVTDPDGTDYLQFKLLDKTVPFMLDDQVLRTVDVINAERNSQYSFKVLIIDEGIPSFTVTTLVKINVTDVNDNIPLFKSTHYVGSIQEHGSNNKVEINPPIVIEDPDISSRPEDLRYVLIGDHGDMFRINPLTAEIQAVTPEDLDCEEKCLYNLKIKVADEKGIGLSSTVPLTITIEDVNDQAPTFDFIYSVHLNISTLPGWQVVTLRATDKDLIYPNNHIIYLLEDGFGKFSIDSKTGEIWLTHSLMDGEVHDKYELKVSAIDSGIPTQTGITTVTINVIRNHPPTVDPVYNFLVKEDHPVRSFIGVIDAKDPEGLDNIQYRINGTEIPFYIGPESGEIFTTAALDREKDAMFKFNVYVIDYGVPEYTVTSAITVYIEDVNDNPPIFKDGDYAVYLPENEVIQELKFKPNVSDNDVTPINQQIKFFMDDPSQLFHVDELTGRIETKYPMTFDCEKQHMYNITLIAQDGGGLKSSKKVNIHIMDKNDERPRTRKEFNFTVHPSRQRGAVVGRVTAEDLDYTEENQQLTYILKNGGLGKFSVDDGSGIITLSDSVLAHPYKEAYQLLIEIKDSGKPRLSTETLVNVIVPMDSAPRVPDVIHVQIEENAIPPIVGGRISNKEPVPKKGSVKPLHFLISNTTAPFVIDEKSGDISLVRRLDSETMDQYRFTVDVVKYGYPNYTITTEIIIEVVDVNDNYPVFSSPSGYIGHIDEDLLSRPPSTKVELNQGIFVSDGDVTSDNREIKLRLIGSVLFDVDDTETGVVVIKPGYLDAEDAPVFHLLLEARDMNGEGLITTTNVTIYIDDVNDHPPVFEDISDDISISYLTSRGTKIGTVTATDRDVTQQNSQITYWLIEGGYGKFDIQPETGDVIIADDLSRDPCLEMYSLSVLAVDNGFPRLSSNITMNITVSINKPPVLEPIINVTVLENENTSTNVAQINIDDPDFDINKHESIEFYLDDIDAPFELDKYSGMLRTNGPIDREMTDHVSFMVRVVNDGAPPYTASTMVTVSINDTNDNPPIFSSPTGYLVHIPEDISNNADDNLVELNQEFHVTDEDKTEDNRNILIKLIGDGSEKFEFDQESGKLRLLMPEDFDCEKKCRYEFKVIATDQNGEGLSTSTNLTVQLLDVNDHRPIFQQQNYTFTIHPSAPRGFIGGVSADDEDATNQNNQITYLHKSGGFGKFYVDPNTGEIHVVDSLIREPNLDQYQLVIIAQDNGVPRLLSTTNVTIDVPVNHPPVFGIYRHNIEVPEDVPIGNRLLKITAKDKDIHQTLTYALKEKRGPFSVNPVTGWLQVKRALDRENHEHYKLHVLVKDGGEPELTASCEIRVTVLDVNDNAPIYEGGDIYQGFVEENIKDKKKRQIVHLERNISVSDHDATFINNKVKLYLHGLGSNLFKLDSKTGQIVTAKTANIDREIHDFFHFKIAAVDSGTPARTSTATVFISVADVNDNHPVFLSSTFTFTVPEEIEPGGVIGRVMAVDKDATQPNNLLLYLLEEEPSGKFKVDINTGTISVSEGFFASPRKSVYRFNVTARDLGFPAGITSSEVTVLVPGVDYKLQYSAQEVPPSQTVMVLKEEVPNGTVIGRLDSEINHQINNIQLDPSNKDSVPFTVNRDGTVVTTGRIDRETGQPFYNFKVLTMYNCTPQINTTRDVTAIVDDVNDNPPSFPLDEYTHTVSREFPTDSVVATPVAFDELDEKPSAYSYSLSGPTMECFAINKTSGVVTTTDQIQNLTAPQILSYTVTARDIHNPVLFARTRLRIHVIPNNSSNINNSC